jgi:hypothetical protein
LTPRDWEYLTLRLGNVLDNPERESDILKSESPEMRRHLETLLAAHRGAGSAGEPRRVIAGRYELLRLLGSGGNGEAWLGLDLESGRQVVLKMPLHWEWYRDDLSRRFLAEAEVLRGLDHPGIVAMLGSGSTAEGAPFFVMPYVEGLTLRERLEHGPLDGPMVAVIVEQLGEALAAAHRKNVVHRDIKPENIMLQPAAHGGAAGPVAGGDPGEDSADGLQAMLIDFGTAIPSAPGSTAGTTTSFFGTTRYMAPEQLIGKPAPASDVYALALVAYEMLAGRALFVSENPVGLFEEQRSFRESALSAFPYSVRYALTAGLRWTPEKRPPVHAFAAALASGIRRWGGYWKPSRRLMLSAIAAGSPLAAWLAYQMRPLSAEERIVVYKAGQTFEEVGWRKLGAVDVNVTIVDQKDPNNQTILGNRLVSSDQGAYTTNLSERVRRAGLKRPWRLTGHVMPVHGSCHFGIGFKELGVGFVMAAVRPDDGRSFVGAPMRYTPKISAIETPATFRTDRMTEMKMTFDPATRTVSIAVDGRILISGYKGRREFVGQGIGLGFSVEQSRTAEGIFGDVSFVMD